MTKRLSDTERLAVAQAVFKAMADEVSTKNPDGLRGRMDARLLDAYEATGAKSFDLKVDGKKVGTYSVVVSKARPEQVDTRVAVTDHRRLARWLARNLDELAGYVARHGTDVAAFMLDEYGELPDGCETYEVLAHEAEPERAERTTLRVDGQKVAEALRGRLPEAVAGLLEGGENG